MKTTRQYLDEAKEKLGLNSNYKMARWLGVTDTAMSQYKTGIRTIDDYTAVKIAEALGVAPLEIIAVANMEREKTDEKRDFWRRYATGCLSAGIIAPFMYHDVMNCGFLVCILC